MVPLTDQARQVTRLRLSPVLILFGPSRDWIVWLRQVRKLCKIRQCFKNQDKELSISKGRELQAQFQENGYVANKYMDKHMERGPAKTSF